MKQKKVTVKKQTAKTTASKNKNVEEPKVAVVENYSFKDWSKGSIWKFLSEEDRPIIAEFNRLADRRSVAWIKDERNEVVMGEHLEGLMMDGFVDSQVIDWYTHKLKEREEGLAKDIIFLSSGLWIMIKFNHSKKTIKATLNDKIDKFMVINTGWLCIPFNTGSSAKSVDGYHWTLLIYDNDIWRHKPKREDIGKSKDSSRGSRRRLPPTKIISRLCPLRVVCCIMDFLISVKIQVHSKDTQTPLLEISEKARRKKPELTYGILSEGGDTWKIELAE